MREPMWPRVSGRLVAPCGLSRRLVPWGVEVASRPSTQTAKSGPTFLGQAVLKAFRNRSKTRGTFSSEPSKIVQKQFLNHLKS